ncbi:TetR/AcrR family transcriptional regulator [Anaerostipes sp.]|uniref:TetR/AcrR family transcriptional regulator n=1 Tax=Anaerostipes sp. TaxID=1872530 RepID=UPI0025C143AD|nr:TetR/AcrR family transcriptional regulator [Anaerostipes sp.]MBS7009410.1 TetR/AcrR family transcriptional regulator [Anaerostipes sp.]
MNKRGKATKKLIKEQACLMFANKGFKDVTMKDICDITGLSRGGLYCHYSSTKEIFKEITDDMMKCQDDEFQAKIKLGLPAVQILDDVLERYEAEMIDSGHSLSTAIYEYFSIKENSSGGNVLYNQYLQSYDTWEKLIQYGIDRGEFHHIDIPAVFDLIIFSYQGVRMYSKLMPVNKEIPKRMLKEIRKLLVIQGE